MKTNKIKLYNLIFPIWLLWLIPITWIIVLPANFLIDLVVVKLTLKFYHVSDIKRIAESIIVKVWVFGFIADFIGTAAMFMANVIDFDRQSYMKKWWYENISNAVSYNPFDSIYAVIWVTVSVVITACCIYFFNYKICLKKAELSNDLKKKLALSLSIFTAPYVFYLPTAWFFYILN